MKKLLFIFLLFPLLCSGQVMIYHKWMKTALAVTAQANTSGYTLPSYPVLKKLNYAHIGLHAADVWDDMDVLWILAQDGGQDYARINHKDPANYLCTLVNSPTFTTNEGFKSNGTTSYVDTNWAPSNGVNYLQNDAHWCIYVVDNLQGAIAFGTDDVSSNTRRAYYQPRSLADQRAFAINSTNSIPGTASTDSHGFHYMERGASNSATLYVQDVSTNTVATTSATRSTKTVYICALHAFDGSVSSFYTGDVGILGFGRVLNSTKRTAQYNALRGYFLSL
jgi:hypothetical protein